MQPTNQQTTTLCPGRIYIPDIESPNRGTSLNAEFCSQYISTHSDIQNAINHELKKHFTFSHLKNSQFSNILSKSQCEHSL